MRRVLLAVSFLGILAGGGAHAQESDPGAQVRLELTLIPGEGSHRLRGVLKSDDKRSFTLLKSDLPWSDGRSLHFDTFIPDSRGAQLGRAPLPPPAGKKIQLAAGSSLAGELDLSAAFPGLESMLKVHPVIIHWAYQFNAVDPVSTGEWQAGSFVIPRTRPANEP